MSLAARCTNCHTVFRITGPQLAAAQGWVRCGTCAQVFDASSNLVTPEGQALELPVVQAPAPNLRASWQGASTAAAALGAAPAAAPAPPPAPAHAAPTSPVHQPLPDIDLELPDLGALKSEALENDLPRGWPGAPQPDAPQVDASHTEAAHTDALPNGAGIDTLPDRDPQPDGAMPAAGLHEPQESLGAQAEPAATDRREPFWNDDEAREASHAPSQTVDRTEPAAAPGTAADADARDTGSAGPGDGHDLRGAMGSAAARQDQAPAQDRAGSGPLAWATVVLLLLSLSALLAYALRGHIVQTWPQARLPIMQACAALGCKLPALRLLEALEVRGSSLSLDDASGRHRLRVTLGHKGELPALAPALDLSLLDAKGQVLARRMIDPVELDTPLSSMEPGQEIDLTLTLDLRGLDASAIGSFKVEPYYP